MPHCPGAGTAFRTRHCHLWLLSSAESCYRAGQFWQSKAENPRERSQARGGLDASLPPCPRSGSRLNSYSRLQSLCATKKREGYILPAASNAQKFPEKDWLIPPQPPFTQGVCRIAGQDPHGCHLHGKDYTKQTKIPWEEPFASSSDSPSLCNRFFLLESPPERLARKISSKGQKEEPD